jgi:succinylglutamate desuccinylase
MLEENLARFHRNSRLRDIGASLVEPVDDHGFVLRPPAAVLRKDADVDLVFMALTHGNESGGLLVINAICDYIAKGLVRPTIAVGFILANVAAAIERRRFLDRDLNRSFGRDGGQALEHRRAREIEKLLRRARYLVDLHQTIEPSDLPFFVFAYQESSARFATAISPELPLVTHWGRPFSNADESCTSDEFMNRHGGIGLGIELGQKGFGIYQIAAGIKICLDAIAAVAERAAGREFPRIRDAANPIYTWSDIVSYPSGRVLLEEGLRNFQPMKPGQRLGWRDDEPILASRAGLLLFPKYVRSDSEPRPAELYRLLRRVTPDELGKGDCMAPAAGEEVIAS